MCNPCAILGRVISIVVNAFNGQSSFISVVQSPLFKWFVTLPLGAYRNTTSSIIGKTWQFGIATTRTHIAKYAVKSGPVFVFPGHVDNYFTA
jgi:hypothetical protein